MRTVSRFKGSVVLVVLLMFSCSSSQKADKDKVLVEQNMADWCNANLPDNSRVLCYRSQYFVERLSISSLEFRPFVKHGTELERVLNAKTTHVLILDSANALSRLRSFVGALNMIIEVEQELESNYWKATLMRLAKRPEPPKRPENGKGSFSFGDGKKYTGNWLSGKMHGSGIMQNPDGTWVKGEWQNGVVNGYATLYAKDSSIIEQGYWDEGLFTGSKPSKSP